MGFFKKVTKAAWDAVDVADTLFGDGTGMDGDAPLPTPVDRTPDVTPDADVEALWTWAARTRAVAATGPARGARIAGVSTVASHHRVPVVRLEADVEGVGRVVADLPAAGGIATARRGDTVQLHVHPADPAAVALAAGSPGRAVVQSTDAGASDGPGAKDLFVDRRRTTVQLVVRLRLAGGRLGPPAAVPCPLPVGAAFLLGPGSEVPVLVDHATGQLAGVDSVASEAELRARYPHVVFDDRDRGPGVVSSLRDAVADLRAERNAPPPEAIEGVTEETWRIVRKALSQRTVKPKHHAQILRGYKVPPERWEAIDAAWSERTGGPT